MTPKETAIEILDKYFQLVKTLKQQKKCALITINEVINHLNSDDISICQYWYEVKQEIEKI
jgi:hypothetical protein